MRAREEERGAIGDAVVSCRLREEHRIVGRDGVEILCRNQTTLGELAFVPAAALDPCASWRGGDFRTDCGGDIADTLDRRVAEIDDVQTVGAATGEVGVGVEKTGRDGAALEIDAASCRAGQSIDLGGAANGGDVVTGDGDGLSDAVGRVDGDDAGVGEDDVGARLLCGDSRCGRGEHCWNEGRQQCQAPFWFGSHSETVPPSRGASQRRVAPA
jgi:hypothetical protein